MVTTLETKNIFDRPAPSADAVIAAVRKHEDEGHLYSVQREGTGWKVTRTCDKTRVYRQCENPFAPDPAFPLTCNCPAHEREGYCKHVCCVENYEALDTAEADFMEREFARYEAEYAGRY